MLISLKGIAPNRECYNTENNGMFGRLVERVIYLLGVHYMYMYEGRFEISYYWFVEFIIFDISDSFGTCPNSL